MFTRCFLCAITAHVVLITPFVQAVVAEGIVDINVAVAGVVDII